MKSLLDTSVTLHDPEIVGRVTRADQIRVLASLGWRCVEVIEEDDGELWAKDFPGGQGQVIVAGEGAADRLLRIGGLIHAVSRLEGIPVLRLVLALVPDLEVGDGRPADAGRSPQFVDLAGPGCPSRLRLQLVTWLLLLAVRLAGVPRDRFAVELGREG